LSAEIAPTAVVYPGTVLGEGCRILDGAVVGKQPSLSPRSTASREPQPPLELGAGTIVSTGAIVFAGTRIGERVIIGDQACVRERCEIGDDVVVGRGSDRLALREPGLEGIDDPIPCHRRARGHMVDRLIQPHGDTLLEGGDRHAPAGLERHGLALGRNRVDDLVEPFEGATGGRDARQGDPTLGREVLGDHGERLERPCDGEMHGRTRHALRPLYLYSPMGRSFLS
jgi:hypothetical protein